MQNSSLVVISDLDRWGHPITPSVSSWVKVSGKDTGGAWAMFEGVIAPRFGPPLHLHFLQEEWFQVMQGEFIFEAGGEQHRMKPGMSILVPRMVPHRFQNIGSSTGRRPRPRIRWRLWSRETSSTHPWFLLDFPPAPSGPYFSGQSWWRLSLRLSSDFPALRH